ncbi:hypothetical protein CBR_g45703 [Chara braunii]|uniref:Very-long-chain aldehyde decarbonylase CER1-like C-terminal domain-containing protein n=1 Tax=Chara braunii TaxID=69332 RepID=A0A388K3L1_CHABU|nr:hypothetical protein CBR_g45703 [Chara braunii]|eukprot:GBG64648.1 hypothetical protein CBR_g45703 [Chara braunii]
MDPQSERLHSTARGGRKPKVDFVFLAHGTDILSILHLPFAFRTLSSYAYRHHWYTIVLWPFVNEALNGGGVVFTKKHEDLKVRVVHGNTLTAAALIHQLPQGVKAVFLAGGSSKLGRAIALYLCKRNVHVAVLTQSKDRFRSMRSELPEKYAQYMIQAETCKDGSTYKHWVVARWLSSEEQKFAPPGAHFYQLAVPPIAELRKDCTYGALIGMRLPKGIENLRTCEMTMERGVVHGCHAGALVHLLEGWDHHEVGAIDPERIDVTWEAAMRLGFQLA